jgi:hypothetical protein
MSIIINVIRHIKETMPFYVPIVACMMAGIYGYITYKIILITLNFLTLKIY